MLSENIPMREGKVINLLNPKITTLGLTNFKTTMVL